MALRVLVITDDLATSNDITAMLRVLGHTAFGPARTGDEALRLLKKNAPDLALVDLNLYGSNGFQVSRNLLAERVVPILLLVDERDVALAKEERASGALAYVVKPFDQEALRQAIEVAISRFEVLNLLRQEAATLREALEARNMVEKAKSVMMRRLEISEVEAFERLRLESASQGKKLRDLAEAVLLADRML